MDSDRQILLAPGCPLMPLSVALAELADPRGAARYEAARAIYLRWHYSRKDENEASAFLQSWATAKHAAGAVYHIHRVGGRGYGPDFSRATRRTIAEDVRLLPPREEIWDGCHLITWQCAVRERRYLRDRGIVKEAPPKGKFIVPDRECLDDVRLLHSILFSEGVFFDMLPELFAAVKTRRIFSYEERAWAQWALEGYRARYYDFEELANHIVNSPVS